MTDRRKDGQNSASISHICTARLWRQVITPLSPSMVFLLLLLFWQASLGVCSAKRRHQSPEWTILSHISCFIQGEVIGFQVDFRSCWIVFIHIVRGRLGGLLQFSKEEAVKIFLASVSSDIRALWLKREKRRAWTKAEMGDNN